MLDVAHDASPKTHVMLVGEHVPPLVVPRAALPAIFLLGGWDPRTAYEVLDELGTKDDPTLWPAIVRIDEFLNTTWIRARFLVKGGQA